jgi:crotonobetainyl-CoA:carnitine CoA-transferase CaiB-like acyl-CoA transferase
MSLPEKSFAPDAACPLDGVRVVDLSRLVAGNAVSSQLADFGAEVLKIEDPGKSDPLRAWQTGGVSVHWKLYARNKKSIALSLREARGRELLLDLAASSEVLIENFRPGTLEKMGLGPEVLHTSNPRLIIVRVSGWGQDGPYRDRPGFGTLVESMSGYAARTGFADREPVLPPTALADMVAGLYGAFAVMVALREVEVAGGNGQVIDLPLLDPLFSFIATEAPIYNLTGQIRPRSGSRSETTSPRNVFRTKDGRYIGISASIRAMAERLFRAIGRADMITDPRFRTNSDRVRNAEACEAPIVEFIGARTLAENMAILERAEVTAAPVYDIDRT